MLTHPIFTSAALSDTRKLWVQTADSGKAETCLIILDGELYIDRVKSPAIIDAWQEEHNVPLTCVYVTNKDAASRHSDYTCSESYAQFLVTELLPWIETHVGRHEKALLVGLSLSGLAALFTALRHPGVFAGVMAQSPSAWWQDERLAGSITTAEARPGRFYISVGTREVQAGVTHGPSGLVQNTSQIDSVRRLSEKLKATGHAVHHAEFDGGHDPACWAAEFSTALTWLIKTGA